MDYLVHTLLQPSKGKHLVETLTKDRSSWENGKRTAGEQASKVKNNLQLNKKSSTAVENSNYVSSLITTDALIKSYCLPKSIHGVTFSMASAGQGYGMHIDNAYMSSGRSDLSFTLFLSDSTEYDGGELCIQTMQEAKEIKLSAGQIVIYPSTSLHSVKKVTRGERVVCIGWIQSYIASNEDRNLLFTIDAGAKALLAEHGRSSELDLIFQSYNNLLRRLGD